VVDVLQCDEGHVRSLAAPFQRASPRCRLSRTSTATTRCGARHERHGPEKDGKEETREIPEGKAGSEEGQESRQISRLFFLRVRGVPGNLRNCRTTSNNPPCAVPSPGACL